MSDPRTCPECGAEIAYATQEARVLTGTCGACHRVTTLIEGSLPASTGPAAPDSAEEDSAAATGPECAECGETLTVQALPDGSLEVSCAECESVSRFVPASAAGAPRERPSRDDRPRFRDSERGGPSRARPCRQCGAPLSFSTDEDGQLVGECSSCGNRFVLPPRQDNFRGRSGARDRSGPRGGRTPSAGWAGGNRGYGRDRRYRSPRPRRDDGDDAPRRRRRAPPSD